MQILIKVKGSGSYVEICNEGANSGLNDKFAPAFTPVVQEDELPGSQAQFRTGRGNVKCAFELAFDQNYTTRALALDSTKTIGDYIIDSISGALSFKFIEGATTHYYGNAQITNYQPDLNGASVLHRLQFNSDYLSTSDPG